MEKRIVAITGSGSGLGACLAQKYSDNGDCVVLLDVVKENLKRTADSLKNEKHIYVLDISSKQEVSDTFSKIYKEVGNIDVLINCAGIGYFDIAENIEEKYVHALIDINLKGTIFCTQEVIVPMKEQGQGQIINVISMSGKRAVPNESVYCASKYGVTGFMQALAIELAGTGVSTTGFYMENMATGLWKGERPKEFDKFIKPEDMADIIFENMKARPNIAMEEVLIKNIR